MSAFVRSKKDVILALALASGATAVAAAEQLKISDRTVRRRLADPAFRQLVAEMRADFIAQAVGRLTQNMTRAADGLVAMLDSGDERVRLRVIRALLTLGHRLHDAVDLELRIRNLEQDAARKQGGQP
jgi:predicted ArsR family transcriptional regulator